MKKLLLTVTLVLAAMFSSAQDSKRLYRLYIGSADPQTVYRMLAGITTFQDGPEISTVIFRGGGNGGFGDSGFGGGRGG